MGLASLEANVTTQSNLSLVEQAQHLMGPYSAEDAATSLGEIPERLPNEFAKLRALFETPHIRALMEEYDKADQKAKFYQAAYLWTERMRIWLFFSALVLGSLSLTTILFKQQSSGLSPASITQFSLIALAFVVIFVRLWKNFYARWRGARAKAEYARGRIFWGITTAPSSKVNNSEIPVALQKLEFLRRFRLQRQYDYFRSKAEKHESSNQRRRTWLIIASVLAFFAASPLLVTVADWLGWHGLSLKLQEIGALIPKEIGPTDQLFLALGSIAAGFEASITNHFRIAQDLRFASHFKRTGESLLKIANDLPKVRADIAAGGSETFKQWANDLENVLLDEHEGWMATHSGELNQLPEVAQLDSQVPKLVSSSATTS